MKITFFLFQAGLLRTEHGEYWVEPSLQHSPNNENEEHPHVIYKRSALKTARRNARREARLHRDPENEEKKHKKGRRKRRRRRSKNCATKEPPRTTKLVEWNDGPGQTIIQEARSSADRHIRVSRSVLIILICQIEGCFHGSLMKSL